MDNLAESSSSSSVQLFLSISYLGFLLTQVEPDSSSGSESGLLYYWGENISLVVAVSFS